MAKDLVLLAIISLTILITYTYTLTYHDCNDVTHINTFKINKICTRKSENAMTNTTEQVTILQKKTLMKLSGY